MKNCCKLISVTGDRVHRAVTVKSPDGTLYRYLFDLYSKQIARYKLQIDISTKTVVCDIKEREEKRHGKEI